MPKLRSILPAFALLLFAVAAHTQGTVVTSVQVGQGTGSGAGSGSGKSIGNDKSVPAVGGLIAGYIGPNINGTKGQPFSADVIDESDQFLADGNHIHRENHGKMFRDSEGRSRNEMEFSMGRPVDGVLLTHITITDPVQGQFISLDPRQKQATVRTMGLILGAGSSGRPVPPADVIAKSPAPGSAPAEAGALLQTLRSLQQAQGNSGPPRVERPSHEDLGTMVIEGFTVTGTRYTHTVPAGQMGNDKPMITTTERWFSADLKMDLLFKSESPESGLHTHKLVNIRAGDPDPLLFQVPADYTVEETPPR
jgi:hypothetical protein